MISMSKILLIWIEINRNPNDQIRLAQSLNDSKWILDYHDIKLTINFCRCDSILYKMAE